MTRKKLFLLLLGSLLACSCSSSASSSFSSTQSEDSSQTSETVNVAFVEDECYSLPQYLYTVPRGSDLEVELTLHGRNALTGVSYADSSFELVGSGKAKVVLRAIRYATRVEFSFSETATAFVYHLNGGHFLNGSGDRYALPATDKYHGRPNLDMGIDRIAFDRHTLIGWKDEDGEVIGLGSRYTIPNRAEAHFDAVWMEWSPLSSFRYVHEEDGAYLTGYWGESECETLVIPAEMGGKPVKGIRRGFALHVSFGTVVLPLSLKVIEPDAFYDCSIEHLYLFDAIQRVENDSFNESIVKRCHLLYSHPPRGLANDPNTQFVEDMDRLILRKDKKKIVYFAGCSGSYSIDSPTLERVFGDEYEICNMAVLGGTNGSAMMEAIIPYLGPGDLFIHAPEEMSEYQLMHNYAADNRLFFLFMGNYDALSLADVSIIPNFWTSFGEYLALLEERLDEESFIARSTDYNEYGDYRWKLPNSPEDTDFGIAGAFYLPFCNATSLGRLNDYYEQVERRGATSLFTFGPINRNAVDRLDPNRDEQRKFVENLNRYLTVPDIISEAEDSVFPGTYFFDTDYHMSYDGRLLRTAQLVEDLEAYLSRS